MLALPAVLRALDATELALLAAGGVLYTVGAIGLWLKRPNPSPAIFGYHEVWHAMTLAAAGLPLRARPAARTRLDMGG